MKVSRSLILSKRRFVTLGTIWFGRLKEQREQTFCADIIYLIQSPEYDEKLKKEAFSTSIIDLTQSTEDLWSDLKKETRYEVRRAQAKDCLSFHIWQEIAPEVLDEFYTFFQVFSEQKGRSAPNKRLFEEYVAAKLLVLSKVAQTVKDCDSPRVLSWHAYICDQNRARLLYSASHFRGSSTGAERSLIGRANRFHHWADMESFKARGVNQYDLGGWYAGESDVDLLKINKFKEEFGGKIITEYNYSINLTLKGRIYSWLKSLKNKSKS